MTITKKSHVDRTFYYLENNDSLYTVVKSSINEEAVEWIAIANFISPQMPYETITTTELGQSLISYCQENP